MIGPLGAIYPPRMTYYRALGFGLRDEFADEGAKTLEEVLGPARAPVPHCGAGIPLAIFLFEFTGVCRYDSLRNRPAD
jgi:hypothetical protein